MIDENYQCYMQALSDCNADTLLKIIQDHTNENSIICSSQSLTYDKLNELYQKQLGDENPENVNQTSLNFLDPNKNFFCTSKIDDLWTCAKSRLKEMRGCLRLYIQGINNI